MPPSDRDIRDVLVIARDALEHADAGLTLSREGAAEVHRIAAEVAELRGLVRGAAEERRLREGQPSVLSIIDSLLANARIATALAVLIVAVACAVGGAGFVGYLTAHTPTLGGPPDAVSP